LGDLATTPGALENSASSSRSLSTSTVALNKTQLAVGGSVTASLYLKDAYGNSITTTPAGIGAASFGTKTPLRSLQIARPPQPGQRQLLERVRRASMRPSRSRAPAPFSSMRASRHLAAPPGYSPAPRR
jgi:hypothetical protein